MSKQSNMKLCPRCGRTLESGEFNFKHRATGKRQVYCRMCSREYVRDHYKRNVRYYINKALARRMWERHSVHERLLTYLRSHPCIDCGEADPVVLEFDHLDRSTKATEIGTMLASGQSWRTIQAEIAKCVVRCANCHRRRTARQFGWYRLGGDQVQRP